jgi:hypothetical protein
LWERKQRCLEETWFFNLATGSVEPLKISN